MRSNVQFCVMILISLPRITSYLILTTTIATPRYKPFIKRGYERTKVGRPKTETGFTRLSVVGVEGKLRVNFPHLKNMFYSKETRKTLVSIERYTSIQQFRKKSSMDQSVKRLKGIQIGAVKWLIVSIRGKM